MRKHFRLLTAGAAALSAALIVAPAARAEDPAMLSFNKSIKPILTKYCYSCHGDGEKSGNIAFDTLKTEKELIDPNLWFKALNNVRAGLMPAGDSPKLSKEDHAVFEKWIKSEVFKIDPANLDPGRVTLRRLNRTEYRNTIRDLMGYDFDATTAFPQDDTGQGFDNIASVLNISPMLLDKYMQAADKIVKAVVPETTRIVPTKFLTGRDFVPRPTVAGNENRDQQTDARVNIGIAAKYPATVHIDEPGEYRVRAFFAVIGQFAYDRGHANISLTADGEQIYKQPHVWEDEKHGKEMVIELTRKWDAGDKVFSFEVEPLAPVGTEEQARAIAEAQAANAAQAAADQAAAAATAAGQNAQQDAAASQDPAAGAAPARGRGAGAAAGAAGGRRGGSGTQIALRIVDIKIEGPLDKSKWIHPPNYAKYFPKDAPPTDTAQRRQYAADILRPFVTHALRRPVDDATMNRLVNLAEATYTEPEKTFEQGIQQAMIAVLASPRFLFRVEDVLPSQSPNAAGSLIDEYALASRLSYLLWSSMPDDELFGLAQRGELRKNLGAQIKRMLADPRGLALVENFSGQWLRTREVDTVAIDDKWVLARDAGTEAQVRADDEAAAARRGGRGFGAQGQAGQAAPVQAQPNAGQAAPVTPVPTPAQPNTPPPTQSPAALAPSATAQPNQPQPAQATVVSAPPDAQQPQASTVPPQGAAAAQPDQAAATPNAAGARGQRGNRGAGAAGFPAGGRRGGRAAGSGFQLDKDLRTAMRQETEMYFGHIVKEDRSVLELIDSNYTFLNERLARHYAIPGVTGAEMRRVELPADSHRGGILTQGSVLTITSQSTRTSAVKRGRFLLDNILGTPPSEPPPNIPALEESEKSFNGREPTLRETLELHRQNALCASCHELMDPLGLALENFNALGMWRTKERGQDIKVDGELASGEKLGSIEDLRKILTRERRGDYYRTLTRKFMIYALGRDVEYYDLETMDQIVDRLEKENGKFSTLLMGVIESVPFQQRRSAPAPVAEAPQQRAEAISQ